MQSIANCVQDAWDSYIQNTSLDPSNQLWPTSMDPALMTPAAESQVQMGPQAPQANMFSPGPGGYMNVNSAQSNMPL